MHFGRNSINNDYTFIGTGGTSCVDFCLVPYESMNKFNNFEVIKTTNSMSDSGILLKYSGLKCQICYTINVLSLPLPGVRTKQNTNQ